MKRFWVILLTLGLMAAFSTTAMAVDVKVSGEYYAAGMYLDKTTLKSGTATDGPSTAFFYQRLRVQTDFIVSPGLKLVTRFDAMERAWGATRNPIGTGTTLALDSAGTVAENENIAIDWAYIEYKSPIGVFSAGYMNDGSTGTIFGNSYSPKARIKYSNNFGPVKLGLAYTKEGELSNTAIYTGNTADADKDKYGIEGVYNWKGGKAGLNVNYYNQRDNRPKAIPYKRAYFLFTPYAIAKIGPVALQAEFNYAVGDQEYEFPSTTADKDIESFTGWVDATADFGMFYAGGSIAYVSGDNDPNDDKVKNVINGGRDWNPCLIMWNYERTKWAGGLAGYNGANQDTAMANGWLFQLRGGVRPIEKLDVMLSATYAVADKKPFVGTTEYIDDKYGYEVDLTATYKITNNLSYMLGAGYLKADDYYKGLNDANQIDDDFLVINKLTLTF
ncbi:hypothetical protein KN63_06950 [Smithella sp. F21]|nr:hypothetical protein KN63_06950 [Smithella sp. F21]